ncbi:MAG TPA: hotdog domain-containing protein [Acidimicrobiales bacterium]|nr:hotdog domain-containing protein [Acidimicrobiales bacterium]
MASAVVTHVVTDDDTAIALRSGTVAVLATPRVVALCEDATCQAIEGDLEPGQTTVGTEVQLKHVAAVAVGSEVRAEATLERVEGRRLLFTVSVTDASGLVAAGKITRVIVDEKTFLDKAR